MTPKASTPADKHRKSEDIDARSRAGLGNTRGRLCAKGPATLDRKGRGGTPSVRSEKTKEELTALNGGRAKGYDALAAADEPAMRPNTIRSV